MCLIWRKIFAIAVWLSLTGAQNSRPSPKETSSVLRKAPPPLIRDCSEANPIASGVYRMQSIPQTQPYPVLCVRKAADPGPSWTVIQQRFNGSVDFFRNWHDYRDGFGNVAGEGEFWLGLDKIHAFTAAAPHELLVELTGFDGAYWYGAYSLFEVSSEREGFALKKLAGFRGSADCLSAHLGQKFSTFDNDNDGLSGQNCAVRHDGAWWYDQCYTGGSNLNGKFATDFAENTINCYVKNVYKDLRQTRLMIRKV
ncbi:microfibril-associated glycoprotein 4-like [Wyeomyia smithii]|uniref:microfibril-associated glycoprotein 4-like n=1 Tax=Wyeomyia smithii TaxID=174621 RepID=UPI002467E763|nr:microfibril-associated glycoprotein 4-like [Wyeomyia smithii]